MDIFTPILIPLAKGFSGTLLGSGLLGSGGYYIYKKYRVGSPLTEYLVKVTSTADKKVFSHSSLISTVIKGNGTTVYRYKIPAGWSVKDMEDLKPGIEDKLDCEIQVWAEEKNFVIEMMVNPIPKELVFKKEKVKSILSKYECAMYLGESRKGSMIIDFTENLTPHLLFGGPTGGGKSNFLNQGICGMVSTYTPEELQLILIDLKDGVEFAPYENMNHVRAFCETFGQVDTELQNTLLELKRRNTLFKEKGVKKLTEYNQASDKPLPRIVIIADEFAQFNNISDKELKKRIYGKWEEILQKGRSTGIHVVIGTQVADADVFPKQVKGNIDARFGFKFTDIQHSKMISGGSELTNLPNIMGRGLFKLGTNLIQTQVPKINRDTLEEVIEENTTVVESEEFIDAIDTEPEAMDTVEAPPIHETKESSIESLFKTEAEWKAETGKS